jgi:hypothetical protein
MGHPKNKELFVTQEARNSVSSPCNFRTPDVVLFKDLSMSKIRTIIPINKKVVFLQE